MNKIITLFISLLSLNLFSQTDKNGNPVFNSLTLSEEKVNDYVLNSNYYTLANNISNKNSSVFITEQPSLDEIELAATKLPSDFFLVVKNLSPVKMIMLAEKSEMVFFVIDPATGANEVFPADIKGDITENRAKEIIEQKFDKRAKIDGNILFFNNKNLSIISTKEIKAKVKKLIAKKNLNQGEANQTKFDDKALLKKIVIKETHNGGKLDFFTEIKGHENDGIQVKPGIFSTKMGIALYKWGRGNYEIGVNNVEDALNIWEEIKERKPSKREIEYITMGFNKQLEN
ncbi:hypothetical protein [Chryseobacterium turcicum]|uniref:Uncharacterized protein n=1 Tax=Chryseobacterium turcicum TaxID=2898076 RepID=A0A9Q3YW86_9FLAO|nr:hypothetical protein [Chryseobacterium turcicum]MCD1118286.1 hypothetical protein [Chryseobacterium turcicum]